MFWKCLLLGLSMDASTLFAQSDAPGRQYDVNSIGWQQEGWRMGPGSSRGVAGHRFWLPWVSANHLYGITGLEEYDPRLFKKLCTKTSGACKHARCT